MFSVNYNLREEYAIRKMEVNLKKNWTSFSILTNCNLLDKKT